MQSTTRSETQGLGPSCLEPGQRRLAVTRKSVLAMVVLSGAAVAACASTDVVVSPTNFYGAYTPTVLNYSATSGGMLVEVVGNPFDALPGRIGARPSPAP